MHQEPRGQKSASNADFEFINKLGKGSFGVVFKVRRKYDNNIYVMKQINISQLNPIFKTTALNEVRILSSLENPYIVKYFDSFLEKNFLNIVMEYCEGGDLANYIRGQLGRPLTENKIWRFFIQMCLGLKYIHNKKILHRDIKSLNIFLTKDDNIRIGDLGVAKAMAGSANFAHTTVGTPYYLSPEMCEEKPYNEKSDIWSLGCVLYEMCTQKPPFEANNQAALLLKILRGKFNPISSGYSQDLAEVINLCLSKDYRKRPSADDLLNRPTLIQKARALGISLETESKTIPEMQKFMSQSNPGRANIIKENSEADKKIKGDPNKIIFCKAKSEPQKPIERSPSLEPPKVNNDNKASQQKNALQKSDMQNNNLFKLFENKGPIVNNLVKDLKKIQLVNPMQFAQIKDGAEKELHSNLLKDRVNGENVPQIRRKGHERLKRISTPQLISKTSNNDPQKKLISNLKVDVSPKMNQRFLVDDKGSPTLKDAAGLHRKNISEIPNQQEDLNLVKNLPEVITPVRAKSKMEPSKADEKKVNFFGSPNRGKKIYIKANKSEYPSFIPNKLILDSKPKPPVFLKPLNPSAIFQHKQDEELPTLSPLYSHRENNSRGPSREKQNQKRNVKVEEYSSPMKGRKLQIPLKQINKHHISFEANDKDHSVDEKRGHRKGDESYREKNNNNYLKNLDQMYQNDKRENKKEILKQNETEEGSDTGRGLKRKEIKTEDMINKLEEMNQKKTSLEHLIKERSNNFISKWGKKAFDELSSFFRTRIGDDNKERTEAEIEEFLNEKLRGEIQPEQNQISSR